MPTLDAPRTSRPAISHDPLPQAGDSLYEQLIDQLVGQVLYWAIAVLFGVIFTLLEAYRYFFHVPIILSGVVTSAVMTAIVAVIAVIKIPRAVRLIKNLKLGIRGEMHIGQYLEKTCRPLGYIIFHDIPCTGTTGKFNIDHALIGPAGVFTVETKNWSLPPSSKGRATITVSGDTLNKSDGTFDTSAVVEAHNNADYLRKLLAKFTDPAANPLSVRPVLVLPGWYVKDPTPYPRPIWILPNDTLHQWLENERPQLSPAQITALTHHLSTHIRSQQNP